MCSSDLATPPPASLPAKGYFLIGSSGYGSAAAADYKHASSWSLSADSGSLQLAQPTSLAVLDVLGWGTTLTAEGKPAASALAVVGGSLERKASAGSTAASLGEGGSEAAKGNGYDSDQNALDWVLRLVRQPQNKASGSDP